MKEKNLVTLAKFFSSFACAKTVFFALVVFYKNIWESNLQIKVKLVAIFTCVSFLNGRVSSVPQEYSFH